MSEKVIQHQLFEYKEDEPFHFFEVKADGKRVEYTESVETADTEQGMLFEHWHEDLEFCYTIVGYSRHHINGEQVDEMPGRMIVTNSEFIHNIIPDKENLKQQGTATLVIVIKPEFVAENFPEYRNIYFTNNKKQASPEIRHCMEKIHQYVTKTKYTEQASLYGKSLVLELLYLAYQEGTVSRSEVSNVNVQKNIERMKGIISYIENHYREHLSQVAVAEKFYFSSVYFSKYFKQCTGMTFTEYVARYRTEQARKELLMTNKSVLDIALDNGFTDDRRFILAFKKYFNDTPLQYRKRKEKK
jgi:AraC-like DNA-binding protein